MCEIMRNTFRTPGCEEVDIMKVYNMEGNLEPSSNPTDVSNVIPKPGVRDDWTPSPDDKTPTIRVRLPEVYGVQPEDYELMTIKVKADNFDLLKVTVTDLFYDVVFNVSFRSLFQCSVSVYMAVNLLKRCAVVPACALLFVDMYKLICNMQCLYRIKKRKVTKQYNDVLYSESLKHFKLSTL